MAVGSDHQRDDGAGVDEYGAHGCTSSRPSATTTSDAERPHRCSCRGDRRVVDRRLSGDPDDPGMPRRPLAAPPKRDRKLEACSSTAPRASPARTTHGSPRSSSSGRPRAAPAWVSTRTTRTTEREPTKAFARTVGLTCRFARGSGAGFDPGGRRLFASHTCGRVDVWTRHPSVDWPRTAQQGVII